MPDNSFLDESNHTVERLGWGILTISARIMSFARSIGWSGPSWTSLARHGPKVVPDIGEEWCSGCEGRQAHITSE